MKATTYFIILLLAYPLYGKLVPKNEAERRMVAEWKNIWKKPDDYIPYHGGGLLHRVRWRLYVTNDTAVATNDESGPICLLLGQKDTIHFKWDGSSGIGTTSILLLNLVGSHYTNPRNGMFKPLPAVHPGDWILATGWLQYNFSSGPTLYLDCEEMLVEQK
jgi:hypothetical protein